MVGRALITGLEALHRLDQLAARSRDEFEISVQAAEAGRGRRAQLSRLKADAYAQLAKMRLAGLKAGDVERISTAEKRALDLLDKHAQHVAKLEADAANAAAALSDLEARRRIAEAEVEATHDAYEHQVEQTEERIKSDTTYLGLTGALENARAIAQRASMKCDLAKTDREEKGRPYEADPLFQYLWKRKFRTSGYRAGNITRMLDGWVAKVSGYDAAHLNFARLTELPDRLAEHVAQMNADAETAVQAIEAFEAEALRRDGADMLADRLKAAKAALGAVDAELAAAEERHGALRKAREAAATGDDGPEADARRELEAALAATSIPDLRVLAAETTTPDDDKVVDALVKLRTEELQVEIGWRKEDAVPTRRRNRTEALESARRNFRAAGLDGPYVALSAATFETALEAWARDANMCGEDLWQAILSSVRQAPTQEDRYFGGSRRGRAISIPPIAGHVIGAVLGEIIREAGRQSRGGKWDDWDDWDKWTGGGSRGEGGRSSLPRGGRSGGGRGGRFRTGGRF
jgi:hypothetical protein